MAVQQDTDLLTIAEAAELLKVSRVTIQRWLKQGRLPAYRVGPRAVRIKRTDALNFLTPHNGATESMPLEPLPTPAALQVTPLTPEEIERRRVAIIEAKALRAEMLKQRGGVPFPSSWRLIRRARDERSKRI
jgi:excisionase family DNA binding protein